MYMTFILTKGSDGVDTRPKILWSLFFSQNDTSGEVLQDGLPDNMFVLAGPNLDLDFDFCIAKVCIVILKLDKFLSQGDYSD